MKLAVRTGNVWVEAQAAVEEMDNIVKLLKNKMWNYISSNYKPNFLELMIKDIDVGILAFISTPEEVFKEADVNYIDARTSENASRKANIPFFEEVVTTIALTAKKDTIVVTKSPVPDGTNDRLLEIIGHNKLYHINIVIVSNLKFFQASIKCRTVYLQKVSESFNQVVNKVALIRKLNAQLHASLESWCG